ncbi:MAG: NADH-quinone oxidoreductase subunit H [Myxococcales bacterium]|nr:NADH-quinone oxidoreductase subunit H [Myxococcales bacterium]
MNHVAAILSRLLAPRRGRPFGLSALCLAVLVGLLATACGEPPTATEDPALVRIEPGQVIAHPDTRSVEITVVNVSERPVVLSGYRVSGPDFPGFQVAEDAKVATLPPGQRSSFHLGVDGGYFLGPHDLGAPPEEGEEDEVIAPNEYRSGEARLELDVRVDHTAARGPAEALSQPVGISLTFEDPPWTTQYLVPALLKILLLVMGFIMPLASLLTWMERKQSAMMQDRVGPNMANIKIGPLNLRLWGIPHFIADGVKMLFKEDFIPKRAHRALYSLAPLFAFIPALVVFTIVPFGDALCYGHLLEPLSAADVAQCADGRGGTPLQIAQIDVGLLYYFAIASLATYGTALAGWSSYNKWAILGALRASAQMISYEVAIGLTIVGALLVYGTLEPHALVKAQEASYWGIALQPLAFILFFTAAMAETKRAPFDLPEGESEIIGYFIEYSGMRFGLFFLGEFIEVIFMSAMLATLFLGGWGLPFGMLGPSGFSSPLMAQLFLGGVGAGITVLGVAAWRTGKAGETFGALLALVGVLHLFAAVWSLATGWGTEVPHILVVVLGLMIWGGKVFLLCALQLLIRWTLPRFRYDQLMSLGWKGLLPLSIANIVLTAIVVYLLMPGAEQPPTP